MQCPRCQAELSGIVNFCNICGADLRRRKSGKPFWIIVLLLGGIILYSLFYPQRQTVEPVSETPVFYGTESAPSPPKSAPAAAPPPMDVQTSEAAVALLTGEIVLEDITGGILFQSPVLAVSGGWVALPVVRCYGGYRWLYNPPTGSPLEIRNGILRDYDRVGLWRVDEAVWLDGPKLMPWNPGKAAQWVSLRSDKLSMPLPPGEYADLGRYARVELPATIDEPGVFFQQGDVVGWSFGTDVEGGFMWIGDTGENLNPFYRVDDFYRLTFSGSREEAFLLALAERDVPDVRLLSSLAGAFLLDTRIPVEGIPPYLQVEAIGEKMRALVSRLSAAEQYWDIAYVLDAGTLVVIRDEDLTLETVSAVVAGEGAEAALELIAALRLNGPSYWFSPESRLTELSLKVYRTRLNELMEDGFAEAAGVLLREARSLYPEDPDFYLKQVRLTLDAEFWQDAEELLLAREFPPSFQDTVENLQNRISELKAIEGRTVIRFRPGSKYIPVQATLNGSIPQSFLIDTGATVSTIPPSRVKDLGLRILRSTPKREFYTAGGVEFAHEITIGSVLVGEWEVYRLDALVVELPQNPELGLLGMNFLNQFKMNLNTEEGVLILEPR